MFLCRNVHWLSLGRRIVSFVRRISLPIVVACMVAAISMAAFRSAIAMGIITLLFWAALLVYLGTFRGFLRGVVWFLPLLPLFYLTFFLDRRMGDTCCVFGSDTPRFLNMAWRWGLEDRHIGWVLFTYAEQPFERFLMLFGMQNVGHEIVYFQVALMSVIAVAGLFFLLSRFLRSREHCLLLSYVFALSLGTWSLATVVDTYIVSTAVFVLFLIVLMQYLHDGERGKSAELGFLTAFAWGLSLENMYFVTLFVVAFLLLRKRWGLPWRDLLIYGSSIAVSYGMMLSASHYAAAASPVKVANGVLSYIDRWSSFENLRSPFMFVNILFKTFVSGIVAQTHVTMDGYESMVFSSVFHDPWNWPLYFFLLPLMLFAIVSLLVRGAPALRRWTLALLGTIVLRHFFMMYWTRGVKSENILFSVPTLVLSIFLLGWGISLYTEKRRFLHLLSIGLTALVFFFFTHNGLYLLAAELK